MFFNQDSNCVLKAKLASAVVTSQVEISVTYKDNTDIYHPDAVVATNNTTAVTLLSAPSSGVVNIVELIKIYNPDTQANTVQIMATDTVIYTYTIGAGQSAIISAEYVNTSASTPAVNAADINLSNLTAAGKAVAANMAMPSNSYIDLTLGAAGATYTAPADGYYVLSKRATAGGQYINLYNVTSGLSNGINTYYNGFVTNVSLPAAKNQVIGCDYTVGGATIYFRFVYAQGEV